jgi:hypothetical protein
MEGFAMATTHLRTSEDFDWLFSTHLRGFSSLWTAADPHRPFVAAILTGNEDSPDTIDLYSENHYQASCLRFAMSDDNGDYYLVGVRRQGPVPYPFTDDEIEAEREIAQRER